MGQRFNDPKVSIIVQENNDQRGCDGRVAFIAGKRTGNSVRRNRAKRVLRVAAREVGLPVSNVDVICLATSKTADLSPIVVAQHLHRLLQKSGMKK